MVDTKIYRLINWRRLIYGLSVLLACVGLCGCAGKIVSNKAEDKIAEKLPELIGPAKSYDVKLHGSTKQMIRGKVDEIKIHGDDVEVVPDLTINSLDIDMKGVEADTKTSTLKKVRETTFQATVTEDSLNRYLAAVRKEKPRVELQRGKMVVIVREQLLSLSSDVRLTGRLVSNHDELNFKVDKLEVAGIKTPNIAARAVEDQINPVMELEFKGFAPELTSTKIETGIITVEGTAQLIGNPSDQSRYGGHR